MAQNVFWARAQTERRVVGRVHWVQAAQVLVPLAQAEMNWPLGHAGHSAQVDTP